MARGWGAVGRGGGFLLSPTAWASVSVCCYIDCALSVVDTRRHRRYRYSKLAMASTFVTLPKPFLFSPNNSPSPSPSRHTLLAFRRKCPRVNAIATKWEPSKVVPQADRVLVLLEELPEKSAGGVLLPKAAVKFERYLVGEVLSVGSEVADVEAGKKVLFSDINAYEVDLGTDARHCFCKAGDLLAVVE